MLRHRYALGEALERLDRSPEAAAAYQKALDLKANYFEAAFDLGSEYYKMQQWDKAIAAYEKAVRLKNDNIQLYINLAMPIGRQRAMRRLRLVTILQFRSLSGCRIR